MKTLLLISLFLSQMSLLAQNTIMVIGHRGCRGAMPENTIAGFQKAIEMGSDGIEWDVVVNGEGQLVVSHEPYFHKDFCLDAKSTEIIDEKQYNMYTMTQKEIEAFDCGLKFHKNFPDQVKMKTTKPLLKELVEQVPELKSKRIFFEIKSDKPEYGISQPHPAEYAELILNEVKDYNLGSLVYMSFDKNILEELHKIDPKLRLIYLSEKRSIKRELKSLSFKPAGIGIYHKVLNPRKMKTLRKMKLGIYAWTVNEVKDAQRMMDLGIDGIITDYPRRVIQTRGTYSSKPKRFRISGTPSF